MIPVDLFGQASNMSAVMDFARQHKLKVIEDSAQAIGAEHKSQRVGGIADITTFSFYPTKNLGACGEGGLVTTNDGGIAKVLMQLRNHGQSSQYLHEMVGMNARLDAIQASILKIKLQHLDRWTAERQAHAAQYRELLSDCADRIALPVQAPESTRHVYNQFVVRVADRDKVKAGLAERGIGSGVYYPLCLHQQPCFAELGGKAGDHPKAERAAGEVLALPIFAELSPAQIREVAAALRELATRPLQ
jgi:dTDP-4-amino-4,6-dideoxygalactose transaminase